jgi:hypothetical protein
MNMMENNERLMREAEFYSAPFSFSYSSLNRLLYAPNIFYKEYVLKEREIKNDAHLVEGKLTHYLILDSAQFADRFLLASSSIPTGNTKEVVDVVYELSDKTQNLELEDYSAEILATLKAINLHQKLVDDKKPVGGITLTGDQKRLEKILTKEAKEYFNFLKIKEGKEIIDADTLDKCTRAAQALKNNPAIVNLLGLDRIHDETKLGIYNELEIQAELQGKEFGIKGIIDNMVVDVEKKLITINDLKTSSKSISDFPESVEYWKYWLQAAMYKKLATSFLKDVIDDTWTIDFNFIVVDKYNQVYPFKVSNESMNAWTEKLEGSLKEGAYHYENKDYTLPFKFVAEEVLL